MNPAATSPPQSDANCRRKRPRGTWDAFTKTVSALLFAVKSIQSQLDQGEISTSCSLRVVLSQMNSAAMGSWIECKGSSLRETRLRDRLNAIHEILRILCCNEYQLTLPFLTVREEFVIKPRIPRTNISYKPIFGPLSPNQCFPRENVERLVSDLVWGPRVLGHITSLPLLRAVRMKMVSIPSSDSGSRMIDFSHLLLVRIKL